METLMVFDTTRGTGEFRVHVLYGYTTAVVNSVAWNVGWGTCKLKTSLQI